MRSLTVVALALAVLLAGCGAVGSGPTTRAATSPTTAAQTPPPTTAATETPEPTETPTETAPPPTPEPWTAPDPPEEPIENATPNAAANGSASNRIDRVRFYGTENGSGFSEFDVAAYGNTSIFEDDPSGGDDRRGEPFYFVWIEGDPVARTDVVSLRNESLTTVSIPEVALSEYDPGRLVVRVELLEADEGGTDRYGTWNGTVEWRPAGNEST